MKNKKWLKYAMGILLTLVVLAAVGVAGFRIGMRQNASFTRPAFAHNFDRAPQLMQGNPQDNGGSQSAQGASQNNGGNQPTQGNSFDNGWTQGMKGGFSGQGFGNRNDFRGNDRRGGMPFFSHIFGLVWLVVLGLLVWIGYTVVKKSGWRLSRVQASPAPAADKTPSVEVEEKKDAE